MAYQGENRVLSALVTLLDEPDDAAFEKIRQSILEMGTDAIPQLEKSLENAFEPLVHERIGKIMETLKHQRLLNDFTNWVKHDADDLLRGFILVTQSGFPDLDEGELLRKIEQLRMEIWIELNENLTALENVKVLNHILFDVHHFSGSETGPLSPESHYLNTMLESRKGNPVAFGMFYLILAQKLGLPVYGVNLPQHFILAYLTGYGDPDTSGNDVLFYINPFNKGALFTRREIDLFVKQMKFIPDRSFYSPCSNPTIIKRLIISLKHAYAHLGSSEKVSNLDQLLKSFE